MKYRKSFVRRRLNLKIKQKSQISDSFAIISLSISKITNFQIETYRKILRKILRKQAKILIKVLPFYTVTRKAQQMRMGKGKASATGWSFILKNGTILLEVSNCSNNHMKKIDRKTRTKFPMNSVLVNKMNRIRWI